MKVVVGRVHPLGKYYKNKMEMVEITVPKSRAEGTVPFKLNAVVPIKLWVAAVEYSAKIHAVEDRREVWISQTVADSAGRRPTLAKVLEDAGYRKNEQVRLLVDGAIVTVEPLTDASPHTASPQVSISYPEELPPQTFLEGAKKAIVVNAYERSRAAHDACIAAHGTACACCGMDFGTVYGSVAAGYIHVHHTKPLAEVGEEYEVDPVADLRPFCPNCHATAHLRTPPFSIDEVKSMLVKQVGLRRTAGGE